MEKSDSDRSDTPRGEASGCGHPLREGRLHSKLNGGWEGLPTYRQNHGLPAQGTLAAALVGLDRLQYRYSLTLEHHTKEGPVAQYLVGAKLALRFPDAAVRNDLYSTSDAQSGLPGDFVLGSTVFHVTVSPMQAHYDKCRSNVQIGYDVYLLVPDRLLVGARQNAEGLLPGRISVQSLEAFISQNLEELSRFARSERPAGFRHLLQTYNARVDAIESDKSLLIEMPQNLGG